MLSITFPTENQFVEFTQSNQTFCLVDIPAGGDLSGLERRHNINDAGWTDYVDHFTLCYEPVEGHNRLHLQYRNQYGEESQVYTRQFHFHRE